ncbi:MAG: helical backbone metal receptor [Bacteroidota bacterium]
MWKHFVDHLGREVKLDTIPQRIVSLCPSITETLIELVGVDRVVGRTRFCIHPTAKVKAIKRVGGTKEIKFDRLHALNPDLIVAEKEENTPEIVTELAKHYPVFVVDVKHVEEAIQMIADLGTLTDTEADAQRMVGDIEAARRQFHLKLQAERILYFIWKDPYMVAGKETYIQAILETLGVDNPARTWEGRYPKVEGRQLVETPVDRVWLSSEPYPFKEKDIASFQKIFPHASIQLVDGEMFSWYGVRMKEAFPYFAQLLEGEKKM